MTGISCRRKSPPFPALEAKIFCHAGKVDAVLMYGNLDMSEPVAMLKETSVEQRSGLPGLGDRPSLHPSWGGETDMPQAADSAHASHELSLKRLQARRIDAVS